MPASPRVRKNIDLLGAREGLDLRAPISKLAARRSANRPNLSAVSRLIYIRNI